jgi:hypothetical protein
MASSGFRDSMNSLGWARRDTDLPANTNSSTSLLGKVSSLNPFGKGGYVQLPTHEAPGAPLPAPSRREEQEGYFAREYFHHAEHQLPSPVLLSKALRRRVL